MRVKILGSAAGGGFPQWNCACRNCRALRDGTFQGKARTQAQVAISADGATWFLLGASPDLRSQIEATAELHPREGVRQSPIAGAVLANADIDHVLGLLLLRQSQLSFGEASLGLIVESPSGKHLAYMPAVPQIDDSLMKELESADVLLFDGTFWSDDELIRIQGSGQTALQMGHVPVSADEGSLSRLAGLRRPRKIYMHINNTNPMLNEAGPEYQQVREEGWEIAEDGCQFDL